MSQEIIFGEKVSGVEYVSRPGAYFIVFDNEKVALIKTTKGYFLPGGGIDDDEPHDECLKR